MVYTSFNTRLVDSTVNDIHQFIVNNYEVPNNTDIIEGIKVALKIAYADAFLNEKSVTVEEFLRQTYPRLPLRVTMMNPISGDRKILITFETQDDAKRKIVAYVLNHYNSDNSPEVTKQLVEAYMPSVFDKLSWDTAGRVRCENGYYDIEEVIDTFIAHDIQVTKKSLSNMFK